MDELQKRQQSIGPVSDPDQYAQMLDDYRADIGAINPDVDYIADSASTPALPGSSSIAVPSYRQGSTADTEVLRKMLRERLQAKMDTRAYDEAQARSNEAAYLTNLGEAGTEGLVGVLGGKMRSGAFDPIREQNKQILNQYLAKKKAEEDLKTGQLESAKGLATLEQAQRKDINAVEQQKFENLIKSGQFDVQKEYAKIAEKKADAGQYMWRIDPETGKMKAYPRSGAEVPGETPKPVESFYMGLNPKERQLYDKTKKSAYSDARVKGAQEQLTTIQQIDTKLAAAEGDVAAGREPNLGQLATAINNAARAIGGEKGVMTDADVQRASGLDPSYLGGGIEKFTTKVLGLPSRTQIATLKAMTAASKRIYSDNVNALNQGYRKDFENVLGRKVPESESFIPPAINTGVAKPKRSKADMQKELDEINAKLGE